MKWAQESRVKGHRRISATRHDNERVRKPSKIAPLLVVLYKCDQRWFRSRRGGIIAAAAVAVAAAAAVAATAVGNIPENPRHDLAMPVIEAGLLDPCVHFTPHYRGHHVCTCLCKLFQDFVPQSLVSSLLLLLLLLHSLRCQSPPQSNDVLRHKLHHARVQAAGAVKLFNSRCKSSRAAIPSRVAKYTLEDDANCRMTCGGAYVRDLTRCFVDRKLEQRVKRLALMPCMHAQA